MSSPKHGSPENGSVPTLLEWAGGPTALRGMITAFYDRVERDDLLSPFFPGGVSAEHREHVSVWWIEVFGGPPQSTQTLGGYENMLAHHRGSRSPRSSGSVSRR